MPPDENAWDPRLYEGSAPYYARGRLPYPAEMAAALVASVFSLSWAAPHLFADRIGKFETELRRLLRRASPDGRFAERPREIELVVWTK